MHREMCPLIGQKREIPCNALLLLANTGLKSTKEKMQGTVISNVQCFKCFPSLVLLTHDNDIIAI